MPSSFKELKAFCLTAQTLNMSEAAERLNLSQPSISLLIKSLEKELDTPLFKRNGPKIELTTAGEILFNLALNIVEKNEQLHAKFRVAMGQAASGEINIAAGESTILYLLPEYITSFNTSYPDVSIQLHNVTGRDGMQLLRSGSVDFAVGSLIDVPDDIEYHPIFSYKPVLIMPTNHPLADKGSSITLEDISQYGLILPPRHLSTWRLVKLIFTQRNLDYKVVLEAGGWEVVKKYVALGMGISIVTDICLTEETNLAKIPLDQYFPSKTYGVVLRKEKVLSPQAKAMVSMMDPNLKRLSDEDD